jgi:hypothetical protein
MFQPAHPHWLEEQKEAQENHKCDGDVISLADYQARQ